MENNHYHPVVLVLHTERRMSYPIGRFTNEMVEYCKDMADKLKALYNKDEILTFCVRGSSGAILSGLMLSMMSEYEINICHVKKDNEDSHSGFISCKPTGKLIIIDDFISSGRTIHAIWEAVGNRIDTLCVSGVVDMSALTFYPKNIICGSYKNKVND